MLHSNIFFHIAFLMFEKVGTTLISGPVYASVAKTSTNNSSQLSRKTGPFGKTAPSYLYVLSPHLVNSR